MTDSVLSTNARQELSADRLIAARKIEQPLMAWHDRASYEPLTGDIHVAAHNITVDDFTAAGCAGPATLSLSIVLEGSFSFQLDDGVTIDAAQGSAILYCAPTPSIGRDILKPGQRLSLIDLRFGHDHFGLVSRAFDRHGDFQWPDRVHHQNGATSVLVFRATPRLMSLAEDMSRYSRSDPLRPLYLQARALDAFIAIIALLREQSGKGPSLCPSDILRIDKVEALLNERYSEKWTISRIARSVGISERKLKFGFKHVKGATLHCYLRNTRLKNAKRMLEQGASVTHVAFATGFSSPSHLTKCFKGVEGISPSRYAKVSGLSPAISSRFE